MKFGKTLEQKAKEVKEAFEKNSNLAIKQKTIFAWLPIFCGENTNRWVWLENVEKIERFNKNWSEWFTYYKEIL